MSVRSRDVARGPSYCRQSGCFLVKVLARAVERDFLASATAPRPFLPDGCAVQHPQNG
jgi:hypothetical protein